MHDQQARTGAGGKPIPDQGLGVLCPEAQADGVPCSELGRECDICPMAAPNRDIPEVTQETSPKDQADGTLGDW